MTGLPVIVFDVNETLLDLESLTPTFERIFGDRLALRRWFAELILYSEALTLAGIYVPFTDIGGAVLNTVATTAGISISAADRAELTRNSPQCRRIRRCRTRCEIERCRFPALHSHQQHGRNFRTTAQAGPACWMPSSAGSASMRSGAISRRRRSTRLWRGHCKPSLQKCAGRLPYLGHVGGRGGGLEAALVLRPATRSSTSGRSHR